jgi:hypothetical protein
MGKRPEWTFLKRKHILRRLRQDHKLEDSLSYIARPCLKKTKQNKTNSQ